MISSFRRKVLIGAALILVVGTLFFIHASSPLIQVSNYFVDTTNGAEAPGYHEVTELEAEHGGKETLSKQEVKMNSRHVRFLPDSILTHLFESYDLSKVDWSKFAYVQYATNMDYCCNALMNFAKLRSKYKTKAELVLIVTKDAAVDLEEAMMKKLKEFGVTIKEVEALKFKSKDETWQEGFTKFNAFGLKKYARVIYFDNDATILGNMDSLFFIPNEVDIAMPLAYDETVRKMKKIFAEYESHEELKTAIPKCSRKSEDDKFQLESNIIKGAKEALKSKGISYQSLVYQRLPYLYNHALLDSYYFGDHFMVLKPSIKTYKSLVELCETKKPAEYDMELINKQFSVKRALSSSDSNLMILPHSAYGALSGTLRIRAYELLHYTDPTEVHCYARSEFDREQNKFKRRETEKHAYQNEGNRVSNEVDKVRRESDSTNEEETERVWEAVKAVHFSDYPLPKPWMEVNQYREYVSNMILCEKERAKTKKYRSKYRPKIIDDCAASRLWNGLYETFQEERESICGLTLSI
ncbi:glucose N-acetyltransferase 1 [[Candida] railenensis]|uniref:Glucose N-acetyltransferase 1 n=1 Tax=[Candida] railenensis TaxID=45579 RepID=A0A9P0W1B2_9ASCO|nr:glucose N-acetyltransferase 1 [[Candida] railenensis]